MKTMKTMFIAVFALLALGCSDDEEVQDDCGSIVWLNQVDAEAEAFILGAITFNQNPNQANCTSLVQAADDFADALEDVRSCVPSDELQEFQTLIDEARAETDTNCSQLSGN